jgi:hypothetical protein
MESADYFKIFDKYSKDLLKIENRMLFPNEVPKTMIGGVNTGLWSAIFNQLYVDGYLKEGLFIVDGIKKVPHYILTMQGRMFIENGGYNALEIKNLEKIKNENERSIIELGQIKSNIETNNSVVASINNQEKYAKRTILALWITVLTSVASVGVSLYTLLDQSIEKELKKQVKSLQEMSNTLQKFSQNEEIKKGDTLNVSLINGLTSKTTQPNSK